jgi:hypothetical protein
MLSYATRLEPGDDLVPKMLEFAGEAMRQQRVVGSSSSNHHTACGSAFVVTAVGSLRYAKLRMANAERGKTNEVKEYHERLEIVSLVGTFSFGGEASDHGVEMHVHMSVSDAQGNVFGGHLMGGTIFTTLELVIGVIPTVTFTREMDDKTGFHELVVKTGGFTESSSKEENTAESVVTKPPYRTA